MRLSDEEVRRKLLTATEGWLGSFGESVWQNVMKHSGVHYIPLSKIQDHGAPMAKSNNGAIVLPDIDCAGCEWTAFVEVKCKTQSVMFRQNKQVRHGIDRRSFLHYQQAAERFRKSCAVAIVELYHHDGFTWSGEVLIERLKELSDPCDGFSNQAHMVYWPKKRFRCLDSFSPSQLWDIAEGRNVPSCELELQQIFDRKKQASLF